MAVLAPTQCKLLTGPAAASAQLLLAIAAFSGLVYKRSLEHPQRPYKVWSMDVSKQVVSSAAAHVCGMIIAVLASRAQAHEVSSCAWYFVAFSFDTTLGVSIAIIFHKAAVKWAKQIASRQGPEDISWQKALAECGSYGDPPSFKRFYIQLAEFSVAVIIGHIRPGCTDPCGSTIRSSVLWAPNSTAVLCDGDVPIVHEPCPGTCPRCCPQVQERWQVISQDTAELRI
ncbi:TPA: hypothetical protein ACH3X3_011928 [Trebouxia sp. C0006]